MRQHTTSRYSDSNSQENRIISKRKDILPNETPHLFFVLTFFLFLSFIIIALEKNLPEPCMIENEKLYPGRFIAERARNHIINLTSIGPRIVGSYENEVLAVKYLTIAINEIVNKAHENHKITLDITKHSGSFPLKFLDGMTNVYRNVQNVVVKIGPHNPVKHSLLMNCHFDTFPESPGKYISCNIITLFPSEIDLFLIYPKNIMVYNDRWFRRCCWMCCDVRNITCNGLQFTVVKA